MPTPTTFGQDQYADTFDWLTALERHLKALLAEREAQLGITPPRLRVVQNDDIKA